MAYHDEKGRITIDAAAANKDIKRLREAIQVLEDSRSAIRSLTRQASQMQGAVAVAVMNQAQRMEKSLGSMIGRLEETIAFIQKTVRHYELLDEPDQAGYPGSRQRRGSRAGGLCRKRAEYKEYKGAGGTPVKAGISGVLDSLFGKK